jgi:(1->4)-alpha-D-glucan 1-alpha-D-glucosylmutase
LARRAALIGALNSLTQVALKMTMPGVPDVYQGTEFWDLSLVDPDNRRPVDFGARAIALASLGDDPPWRALAAAWPDGRIKLALSRRLLAMRQRLAPLFTHGSYQPLEVEGADCDEILAYARTRGRDAVIVAVGRLFARSTDGGRRWPAGEAWRTSINTAGFSSLRDALGAAKPLPDSELNVSELFDSLPVAVLQADRVEPKRKRRSP